VGSNPAGGTIDRQRLGSLPADAIDGRALLPARFLESQST